MRPHQQRGYQQHGGSGDRLRALPNGAVVELTTADDPPAVARRLPQAAAVTAEQDSTRPPKPNRARLLAGREKQSTHFGSCFTFVQMCAVTVLGSELPTRAPADRTTTAKNAAVVFSAIAAAFAALRRLAREALLHRLRGTPSQRGPLVGQDTSNDACLSNAAKQNQTEFLAATTAAMKTIIWLELARLAGGGRAPLWFIARHCPEQSRLFCRHHLLRELRRRPFSTNEDGKPSDPRERAQSARVVEGRLFSRLVTSSETLQRLERVRAATAEAEAPFFQRPLQQQRPQSALEFQRILAARAARNFQAKSARARLRMQTANASAARGSATGMQLLTVTGGGVGGNISGSSFGDEDLDSGDEVSASEKAAARRNSDQPQSSAASPTAEAAESKPAATDEGAEDSDSGSSCRSCLEMVTAQRAGVEKPQAAAGPAGGKKPGLKMAMADFTRKIEDNEGTEISTFSFLGEKDKPAPDEEEEVGQDSAADVGAPPSARQSTCRASRSDRRPSSCTSTRRTILNPRSSLKFGICSFLQPLNRMRRAVKTVNLLIKACTTKEEQTRKNQQRMMTFSDIASSLAQDSQSDELNFQLSYYKAKKEMTLSPRLRRFSVCIRSCAPRRCCTPPWFNANQVIIRQGHNALNFYFIISGTNSCINVKPDANQPGAGASLRRKTQRNRLLQRRGGTARRESRRLYRHIYESGIRDDEPEHISFLREIPTLNGWRLTSCHTTIRKLAKAPGAGALVLAPLVLAWPAPGAGAPGCWRPGAARPGAGAPGAGAPVLAPLVLAPLVLGALVLAPLVLAPWCWRPWCWALGWRPGAGAPGGWRPWLLAPLVLAPLVLRPWCWRPWAGPLVLAPLVLAPLVLAPWCWCWRWCWALVLAPWCWRPGCWRPGAGAPGAGALVLAPPGALVLRPWCGAPVLAPLVLKPLVLAPLVLAAPGAGALVLAPWCWRPWCWLGPWCWRPLVLAPLVLAPLVLAPLVLAPLVLAPLVLAPWCWRPGAGAPGAGAPGAGAPGAGAPGAGAPGAGAPGAPGAPGAGACAGALVLAGAPGAGAPGAGAPGARRAWC
uniref:Cyclic nucleotide-binding domain-containing protein n=1 Tax=Macrostomum lignano TaxID=282301 RepID=A0A1I8IRG4_9PLAT